MYLKTKQTKTRKMLTWLVVIAMFATMFAPVFADDQEPGNGEFKIDYEIIVDGELMANDELNGNNGNSGNGDNVSGGGQCSCNEGENCDKTALYEFELGYQYYELEIEKLYMGFAPFTINAANFEGVDMTQPGATFTFAYAQHIINTTFQMIAEAEFTPGPNNRIEITIANGLALHSATGIVQSGNIAGRPNWIFSAAALPEQFEGHIVGATWTYDTQDIHGYMPLSGTLVYYINPLTTGVAPIVRVWRDQPFWFTDSSRTFPIAGIGSNRPEAIRVDTIENNVVVDTSRLQTFTVTGLNNSSYAIWTSGGSTPSNQHRFLPGEAYAISFLIGAARLGSTWHGRYLLNEIRYELSLPKDFGLTGITIDHTDARNLLTDSDISWTLDTSDPLVDTVILYIHPTAVINQFMWINLIGTLGTTFVGGEVAALAISGQATMLDGTPQTAFHYYSRPQIIVIDPLAPVRLSHLAPAGSHINVAEVNSAAHLVPLGAFRVRNESPQDIIGHRILLEFDINDTGFIGVQAARLFGGPATDVVVTTTTGRIINNPAIIDDVAGGLLFSILDLSTGELNSGEYIKSIAYTTGTINIGDETIGNFHTFAGQRLIYYGRLLGGSAGQSYSSRITEFRPCPTNDWEQVSSHVQAVNIVTGIGSIDFGNGAATQTRIFTGGSTVPQVITSSWGFITNRSNNFGRLWSRQGFVAYVREPQCLYFVPESIHAMAHVPGSSNERDRFDVTRQFVDNTGARVFVIEMPTAILGAVRSATDPLQYPTIQIIVGQATARSTARNGTILHSEIFFIDYMGSEPDWARGGTNVYDVFGFTDNPANRFNVNAANIFNTVNASASLNAATSADRGDGNWQSYMPGIATTIIDLNTALNARYRVQISNSTEATIPGGFVAIIPIPKAGENTNVLDIQQADFGWSLFINEDIAPHIAAHLPPGHTVLYALSYDYMLERNSAGWLPWSAVASDWENIRAVRIAYTGNLPDGFEASFHFPLAVMAYAVQDLSAFQGAINRYSSIIHSTVLGIAGYRPTDPVALRLNTGLVEGFVWLDTLRANPSAVGSGNTPPSASFTPVSGVQVRAYTAGNAGNATYFLGAVSTNASGFYRFVSLDAATAVDIVMVNPGTTTNPMRFIAPAVSEANITISNVMPGAAGANYRNAILQEPFTVEFNSNGGSIVTSARIWINGLVTEPTTTRTGYTFEGWYQEAAFTNLWDFAADQVISNMTLFARWTINTYDVIFDLAGGIYSGDNTLLAQTVNHGANATALTANPTRAGYNFNGWTPTLNLTNVTEDRAFTARWQRRGGGGGGNGGTTVLDPEVPLVFIEDHIWYARGYPDGSFRPGNSITRAEISMILWRLLDSATKYEARGNNFSDVNAGWYAQAISYLASRDIVRGYPDGTFRPNASITRAELTAMMSRFWDLYENGTHSFTDVSGTHWAIMYINNAVNRGWILGYEDGTFRPDNSTTRAEAVTLLNRVLGRIPNPVTIRAHLYEYLEYHHDKHRLFTDLTNAHWAYYQIMEAATEHDFTRDNDDLEIWSEVRIPWL